MMVLKSGSDSEWARFACLDYSIASDLGSEQANLLNRFSLKKTSGLAFDIYPICRKSAAQD
jgi:hypothetical protein